MRYIIGFSPLIPSPYMTISQTLFQDVYDGYLLSEKVEPHITITQFEASDSKIIQDIWKSIEEFDIQPCIPKMIGISFIKGLNEHQDFYWAQIAIERDPIIMQTHYQVLKLLQKYKLISLADSGEIYKPHLTLARIKLLKPIPLWPSKILESSTFKVTLGESDQNGRYVKKLFG